MSLPSYEQFVHHESHEIRAAYAKKNGFDSMNESDLAHTMWRRLVERWSFRDIIHDILGEDYEDGGMGGDQREPPRSSSGGALRIDGQFFTFNDRAHTLIECSDFSLYKRYLDGEDLSKVLEQRQRLGFNLLRVWLLNQSVVGGRNGGFDGSRIHPADYPEVFYSKLPEFVERCAAYGLCIEFTVFTQAPLLMPTRDEQQGHLTQVADHVRGMGTVLLELGNEVDKEENRLKEGLILRDDGVIASQGSSQADQPPPHHDKPWHYELYHTNDLNEWWRKVGHNAMEWADQSKKPCVSNENTRFPDRDSNANHAFDAARGAALLCAGSCYHSEGGKRSVLFTDQELVCAGAWAAGAGSVPLEFQKGSYRHRDDLESPDVIRVYSRTLAGKEYIVQIRR